MNNCDNLTLTHLKNAYTTGGITPRELILGLRAKALQSQDYNAWITLLTPDQLEPYFTALEKQSPDTLPLYGVPFAIKDNIDLEGISTTAGCEAFRHTPEQSAYVVARFIAAGAVPLGKTNLDQFATGLVGTRSPFGQGKNVFNSDYISGGSSAGSAIATALGQVTFALGTDTAGSGRVPAVLNNLIGHKPTKGLLSCTGIVPACKTLDCVSLFTLNAQDAASLLDIAADFDASDVFARPNNFDNRKRYFSGKTPSTFTFGVPNQTDFFGNEECKSLFKKSITLLESLGGKAVTFDMAPFLEAAKLLYEGPWVAERYIATQSVALEAMLPEIQTIIGNGNAGRASDAFSAQYRLAALKRRCDDVLAQVDIAIAPTTPTVFTRSEIDAEPIKNNSILGTYTNFMNLLDYTATAVPIGSLSSGVHWGITLFHQAFSDIKLLNFAQALQEKIQLPYGANLPANTPLDQVSSAGTTAPTQPPSFTDIAVCGAHLEGQPLNWQLTERGGKLKSKTTSSPHYALYALPDGKRPAMVRVERDGCDIEVEVWSVPTHHLGSFITQIPAPLGIGKVELASGEWVSGFICDGYAIHTAQNISEYKGWRNWLKNRA